MPGGSALCGRARAPCARWPIRSSRGKPAPASADEQARLDAYEAGRARLVARLVKLPRCTLGDASVFDSDDTYAQLALQVDPPEAMTEAHRVVKLFKQHCRQCRHCAAGAGVFRRVRHAPGHGFHVRAKACVAVAGTDIAWRAACS